LVGVADAKVVPIPTVPNPTTSIFAVDALPTNSLK